MAFRPVAIPFAVQSNPAEFREQGNERMINCYAVRNGKGKDAEIIVRMSPGETVCSTDADDIASRGGIISGDYAYIAFETGVYKFAVSIVSGHVVLGTRSHIGAITGTGKVYMALNANGQIGVVSQLGRYYVIENDTVNPVNTADIGAFTSICWVAGFFILTLANGEFYATGLNDAYTITGEFEVAEGNPDGLLGAISFGSELLLVGTNSIEPWGPDGSSNGVPFSRLGSSWIQTGCMSFASVVILDTTFYWVANNGIVCRNENGVARAISNSGVERAIGAAASPSTIQGGTYTKDGHIYYVISDGNWTWLYDVKENWWHERKSLGSPRWKANMFLEFGSQTIIGTTDDGNLYELDMDSRLEGSRQIVCETVTPDTGSVPVQLQVASIEINCVTGRASLSGTDPQTNPQIELSYSDDGEATFSTPRVLRLGTTGGYKDRCRANRLGTTGAKFGRRYKITSSDPHIFTYSKLIAWVEPVRT